MSSASRAPRGHALWYAHIIHRVSGLVLALFLPLHFWVLALALTRLSGFLDQRDQVAMEAGAK